MSLDRQLVIQCVDQLKSVCPDYDEDSLIATLVDVDFNVGRAVNRVYDGNISDPRAGLREWIFQSSKPEPVIMYEDIDDEDEMPIAYPPSDVMPVRQLNSNPPVVARPMIGAAADINDSPPLVGSLEDFVNLPPSLIPNIRPRPVDAFDDLLNFGEFLPKTDTQQDSFHTPAVKPSPSTNTFEELNLDEFLPKEYAPLPSCSKASPPQNCVHPDLSVLIPEEVPANVTIVRSQDATKLEPFDFDLLLSEPGSSQKPLVVNDRVKPSHQQSPQVSTRHNSFGVSSSNSPTLKYEPVCTPELSGSLPSQIRMLSDGSTGSSPLPDVAPDVFSMPSSPEIDERRSKVDETLTAHYFHDPSTNPQVDTPMPAGGICGDIECEGCSLCGYCADSEEEFVESVDEEEVYETDDNDREFDNEQDIDDVETSSEFPICIHNEPCKECDEMWKMRDKYLLPEDIQLGWRPNVTAYDDDDLETVSEPPCDCGFRIRLEDDAISLPGDIYKAPYCDLFSLPPQHPGFRPMPSKQELEEGLMSDQMLVLNFTSVFTHFYGREAPLWLPFYAHMIYPFPPMEPYMVQNPPRIVLHPEPGELEELMDARRDLDRDKQLDIIRNICIKPTYEYNLFEEDLDERYGNIGNNSVAYVRGYSGANITGRVEGESGIQVGCKQRSPEAAYTFLKKQKIIEIKKANQILEPDFKDSVETRTHSFDVSVIVPDPPFKMHEKAILKSVVDTMIECGVRDLTVRSMAPVVRAEYEEQATEIGLTVEIPLHGAQDLQDRHRIRLALFELSKEFCRKTGYAMHEQPSLVLPLKEYCSDHVLVHMGINVKSLLVGNCISPGLFFVRGEYFSHYNKASNKSLGGHRNDTSQQTWVTGNKQCLSFVNFEHDRRQLKIYFGIPIPPEEDGLSFCGFFMHITYHSIVGLTIDTSHSTENVLYIHLKHPPQIWEGVPRPQPNGARFLNLDHCREWVRVLSWPGSDQSKGCSQEALGNSPHIALGFYKFSITNQNALTSRDEMRKSPNRELLEIVARISSRCNAPVTFAAIKALRRRHPDSSNIPDVGSFRANYAVHALITRGCKVTDQLFDIEPMSMRQVAETPFFLLVKHAFEECPEACESALENLLTAVDERRIVHLIDAFEHMYRLRFETIKRQIFNIGAGLRSEFNKEDVEITRETPSNCVMVRKVMVCPMRIMFMAPEVMMTNRVVRHFGEEYAMRCVFRDDSGFRLTTKEFYKGSSSALQDHPPIISRLITQTMETGLSIVDRDYEFLAWSNSQMRDHGCYMYATPKDPKTGKSLLSIKDMRDWMGDFSMCRSVPKMMSRMGQCFTQAQPTITLYRDEWTVERDWEGGAGHAETAEPYCFSDGVGRIGLQHAVMLTLALGISYIPSCFQVRFKGFKGVLTLDPTLDGTNGPKIVFRKSQEKFHDHANGDSVLEVVKYAMFSPVCLNRPLITVIDHVAMVQGQDVRSRICKRIHYYLEKELTALTRMLLDERDAAEALTARVTLPVNYRKVLRCGLTITDEPFLRRMLLAIYKYNISQHLSKAKIFLPSHLGRSMYGVLDETGLLQDGQVFIQYSYHRINKDNHKRVDTDLPNRLPCKAHIGRVMVSKNPCRVAGDCRVFDAVWQPALAHLVDVIVFPRYGPRPHPDEMAGSDLDGDEYSVIFDEECMLVKNETAMVFPKTKAEEFEEPPSTADMVAFFLRYLSQDSIGRLSNAHLTAADYYGLFHDIADGIARKCAVAVDFPKTGVPAEQLNPQEQIDGVPDYMGHHSKPLFRSKWLNGELFRKVKKVEDIVELTEKTESLFENEIDRVILPENVDAFDGDRSQYEKIANLKSEYTAKIQSLLDEYGIADEAQVVSGHITSLKRLTAMERDDYSFYHTDKIVEMRYAAIFNHFRSIFFKEFGNEEDFMLDAGNGKLELHCDVEMEKRAVQWYAVTYDSEDRNRTFLSFPWVIWDVISHAKRSHLLSMRCSLNNLKLRSQVCALLSKQAKEMREMDDGFMERISHNEQVMRYAAGYGKEVLDMAYILDRWLSQPDMRRLTPLRLSHLCTILIQYGHGILHGVGHHINDRLPIVFDKKLKYGVAVSGPVGRIECPGEVVVHFLRYLGTHSFLNIDELDLDLCDGSPNSVTLMRDDYWVPVSQIAYKTVHHVAVSGRFESLGMGEKVEKFSNGESRSPLIVSSILFETSTDNRTICETLQEWSGADSVCARYLQSKWYISCVGRVAARQRLARLLLMNPEDLRTAIRDQRIPEDVLDDTVL